MGYSDSLDTVKNRVDLLGPLLEGQPAEWECTPGSEKSVSYQIRECLYIGDKNPHIYPGLAKAHNEFSIIIQGPGSVVTRAKKVVNGATKVVVVAKKKEEEKQPKDKGGELAYGGPQSSAMIVQHWIDSDGKSVLHFPEATLHIEELKQLHKWAVGQKVLLFFKDPMITLRPYDEELAPFSFDLEEDLP